MNSVIEHQLDTFDPEGHPDLYRAHKECLDEHKHLLDALSYAIPKYQRRILEGLNSDEPIRLFKGSRGSYAGVTASMMNNDLLKSIDRAANVLSRMYHIENEALCGKLLEICEEFEGKKLDPYTEVASRLTILKTRLPDGHVEGQSYWKPDADTKPVLIAKFKAPYIDQGERIAGAVIDRVWYPKKEKVSIIRKALDRIRPRTKPTNQTT